MANFKKNLNKKGATGFRPFLISLTLVIVFALCIFLFMINFLEANNPSSEVLNSTFGLQGSVDRLNASVTDFSAGVVSAQNKLSNSELNPLEFIFLIFKDAFYIPRDFLLMAGTSITAIFGTMFPLLLQNSGLGQGVAMAISILIGIISAALILTLVIWTIKFIRTGESER